MNPNLLRAIDRILAILPADLLAEVVPQTDVRRRRRRGHACG
jgi:hypothetical protein